MVMSGKCFRRIEQVLSEISVLRASLPTQAGITITVSKKRAGDTCGAKERLTSATFVMEAATDEARRAPAPQ